MRKNPICIKCGHAPITAKTSSYCKACHAEYERAARAKNPTRYRARGKRRHERIMEELRAGRPSLDWATTVLSKARTRSKARGHAPITATREQVLEAFTKASGRCDSCGEAFLETPHMDHDHETGALRGFLCGPCNLAEGHLRTRERWMALGRYMGWASLEDSSDLV